jgi:lsr operon transcriptional repressor
MKQTTAERDQILYGTRVAWYYYKTGMTQSEIAEKLGLNRARVINILNEAKRSGMVSIHVSGEDPELFELEARMKARWNLREVMLIPSVPAEQVNESLGLAAAQFLEMRLQESEHLVGLGWGSTVVSAMRNLGRLAGREVEFVTLCGGVMNYLSHVTPGNVGSFLSGFFYPFHVIPTPLLVSNETLRNELLQELEVQEVMRKARSCDLALVGIGAVAPSAGFREFGYRSSEELEQLRQVGAAGEIFGEHFDQEGRPLELEHHSRLISTRLEELQGMTHVIGAAGGLEKIDALRGALRGRFLHSLITDEDSARILSA